MLFVQHFGDVVASGGEGCSDNQLVVVCYGQAGVVASDGVVGGGSPCPNVVGD